MKIAKYLIEMNIYQVFYYMRIFNNLKIVLIFVSRNATFEYFITLFNFCNKLIF